MFHLNMNDGVVSECKVGEAQCPLTRLGGTVNHFETNEAANAAMEKRFSNRFSWFGMISPYDPVKHYKRVESQINTVPHLPDLKLKEFVNHTKGNLRVAHDMIGVRVEAPKKTESYRNFTARLVEYYTEIVLR